MPVETEKKPEQQKPEESIFSDEFRLEMESMPDRILERDIANSIASGIVPRENRMLDGAIDILTGGMSLEEALQMRDEKIEQIKALPSKFGAVGREAVRMIGDDFINAQRWITDHVGSLERSFQIPETKPLTEDQRKVMELGFSGLDFLFGPFIKPARLMGGLAVPEKEGSIKNRLAQAVKDAVKDPGAGVYAERFAEDWIDGTEKGFERLGKIGAAASAGFVTELITFNPRGIFRSLKNFSEAEKVARMREILSAVEKDLPRQKEAGLRLIDYMVKNNIPMPNNVKADVFRKAINGMTPTDVVHVAATNQNFGNYLRAITNKTVPRMSMFSNRGMLKFAASERGPLKSNLQAVAIYKLPTSVAAEQALRTFLNSGLSKEEIEFSGVEQFLKDNPKVTKQELLDHIEKNKVKIETVVKGGTETPSTPDEYEQVQMERDNVADEILARGETLETTTPELRDQIDALNEALRERTPSDTKYSKFQLPGGENYREVLVKLPKRNNEQYVIVADKQGRYWHIEDQHGKRVQSGFDSIEFAQRWIDGEGGFRSSHFDEPNILVHLRTNDRKTSDGKKMLFIEEIQSDWHAKGKREGYQKTIDERQGVPNAPFKNTWHELALKQAIDIAVKEGYDGIAFISGQQTADRYNLSKYVDSISIVRNVDGTHKLYAYQRGETKVVEEIKNLYDLPDYIGKEASEKLINKLKENPDEASLSRQDIRIGGNWANKFYDEIMPRTAEKYIKKWGGKVEEVPISLTNAPEKVVQMYANQPEHPFTKLALNTQKGFFITPQMKKEVATLGQPLFGNRLAGNGAEKLFEQRGTVGVETNEPLPDDLEGKPEILNIGQQPPKEPPEAPPTEPGWEDEFEEPEKIGKLHPEEKAEYELFMREHIKAEQGLDNAVKSLGGVRPYAGGKEAEEYRGIPRRFKNKDGMTLDDMATELSSLGFNFEDGEELRQALIMMGEKKPKFKVSKETTEFLKAQRGSIKQGNAMVLRIGKMLSRLIPAGKVKSIVRQATGQIKTTGEAIPESEALKRSLKRQEQVARKAHVTTKREVKETLKLIERVKESEIEAMNYEERAVLESLIDQLKVTRTLEGLRQLYGRIQSVKEIGKQKYAATVEAKNKHFELDRDVLLSTINISEKKRRDLKPPRATGFETFQANALRFPRVLDKIDGGQDFKGPWHQYVYDRSNNAVNEEMIGVDLRHTQMVDKLSELGISIESLGKIHVIDGIDMTTDEILSLYTSMKNPEKALAVIYGNQIPVQTILKAIAELSDQEKQLADFIMQEYEANWPRLRKAFIEYTDGKHDLGRVVGYTPIRRSFRGNIPHEEEIANEMLERQNLKKAYAERGFTKERIKISPEHQTPVRLGEVAIWMEQSTKQEHFISHGTLVKELQRMVNDKQIREAIISGDSLGLAYFDALQSGVNRIANPNIYKAFGQFEKLAKALRGNAALAYLSYNLVTMAKQFPSFLLFLEDVDPVHLLSGIWDVTTNFEETSNLMDSLSPQMKHRSIERELEEIKRLENKGYQKIIKAIGETGMRGIYAIDRVAVMGGWKAVYDMRISEGLSPEEAAREAEKSVLRTQPAAHPKDIANIYATNEFLNWFTQFSNQINQIYNMLTYDIPSQVRRKDFDSAFRAAIGIVLSQYMIIMLTKGRIVKGKELLKEAFINTVNVIPIVGPIIASKLRGWGSNVPALSVVEEVGMTVYHTGRAVSADNRKSRQGAIRKAVRSAIETGALATGAPVAQPRRTIKGVMDMLSGETKDIRRVIWSESALKEPKTKRNRRY